MECGSEAGVVRLIQQGAERKCNSGALANVVAF